MSAVSFQQTIGGYRVGGRNVAVGALAQGHRGGWPSIVTALSDAAADGGIVLDNFVEDTFRGDPKTSLLRKLVKRSKVAPKEGIVWQEPWAGIFHLPPNLPKWLAPNAHPEAIFGSKTFRESLPHLKGGIALTEYHATWLRNRFKLPFVAVQHPTEVSKKKFDLDLALSGSKINLVQVGWYLRNYRAIYQTPVPNNVRKLHLQQKAGYITTAYQRTDKYSPTRNRPDIGEVQAISYLSNDDYDDLLARSLIFVELFDASANNTIVEAIARNTPIVVNRHPAVCEYLGNGYPLLYESLSEVPYLLTAEKIESAYNHLVSIDKSQFSIDYFVTRVAQVMQTISR